MNKNRLDLLSVAMTVGLMLSAAGVDAGEKRSPVTLVRIEASQHAVPQGVRVRASERGLAVSGWVKRRTPDDLRIRGHIEVELVDAAGAVVGRSSVPLHTHNRIPRHQRQVPFATILPDLPEETRAIRIRHRIAGTKPGIG